jgi:hypothetical protein
MISDPVCHCAARTLGRPGSAEDVKCQRRAQNVKSPPTQKQQAGISGSFSLGQDIQTRPAL